MKKISFLILSILLISCFSEPKKEENNYNVEKESYNQTIEVENNENVILKDSAVTKPMYENEKKNVTNKNYKKTFSDEPHTFSKKIRFTYGSDKINRYNKPEIESVIAIIKNYPIKNKYLITNYSNDNNAEYRMYEVLNMFEEKNIDRQMIIISEAVLQSSENYILVERVE